MKYQSVHDYFDSNPLSNLLDTDEDVRLDDACEILEEIFEADIEFFDVHDAIDCLSIHFDVEKKDLLEHYDSLSL